MTLHAPQLPLLQPSFAPVSFSSSRSTSRRLWRASQRNSVSWPLILQMMWSFLLTVGFLLPRLALAGCRASAKRRTLFFLAFEFLKFADPDIAEAHRIGVVHRNERQFVGMFRVFWRSVVGRGNKRVPAKLER